MTQSAAKSAMYLVVSLSKSSGVILWSKVKFVSLIFTVILASIGV